MYDFTSYHFIRSTSNSNHEVENIFCANNFFITGSVELRVTDAESFRAIEWSQIESFFTATFPNTAICFYI